MKFQNIERLFFDILTYSFLLPALSFFIHFNKLKSTRLCVAVTIYSLVIFLLLLFDDFFNSHYRAVYSTFYTTVEYSCFSYVIAQIIQKKQIRIIILLLSAFFIAFEISINFLIDRFRNLDSIPIGVETILIFIYTFYLFYERFQILETGYIYNNGWFWFIVGIIFYLSSSFFFNILANDHYAIAKKYWFLTLIFETVKNILFFVGIILMPKNRTKNKNSSSMPYLDMV